MSENADYRRRYARAARMFRNMPRAGWVAHVERSVAEQATPAGAFLRKPGGKQGGSRVGVLAGSFNPLTSAHVALGESARLSGWLDAIVWVIAAVTVNKERVERASVVDRLMQLMAFVGAGPDGCAVLNRGLYLDQARIVRRMLPDVESLVLIVGYDKIEQILDPRYYDDRDVALGNLFALASVLVAPRGADDERQLQSLMERDGNRRYQRFVASCAAPARFRWDSSSEARELTGRRRTSARARELLAPEGLALARLPGVFDGPPASGTLGTLRDDRYAARQREIGALADVYS